MSEISVRNMPRMAREWFTIHTFRSWYGNWARKGKGNEGCQCKDSELHDCDIEDAKLNWPKRSVLVKMSTGDELNMRIERKTERRKLLI
jgi:hypothetical protein